MDSFVRRIALWRVLEKAREPVAMRALAERFDVSKHTIRRDVDALTTAGIAVDEVRRGQTILFVLRKDGR